MASLTKEEIKELESYFRSAFRDLESRLGNFHEDYKEVKFYASLVAKQSKNTLAWKDFTSPDKSPGISIPSQALGFHQKSEDEMKTLLEAIKSSTVR